MINWDSTAGIGVFQHCVPFYRPLPGRNLLIIKKNLAVDECITSMIMHHLFYNMDITPLSRRKVMRRKTKTNYGTLFDLTQNSRS